MLPELGFYRPSIKVSRVPTEKQGDNSRGNCERGWETFKKSGPKRLYHVIWGCRR